VLEALLKLRQIQPEPLVGTLLSVLIYLLLAAALEKPVADNTLRVEEEVKHLREPLGLQREGTVGTQTEGLEVAVLG
jgi:hypothetical protein